MKTRCKNMYSSVEYSGAEPLVPSPPAKYPNMETSNLEEEVITIPNSNSNEDEVITSTINSEFSSKANL